MTRPKTVTDGRLTRASASLLNSFDPSTPFGCERRGWFKYVAGKAEPQTGNQELGVALHKMNEQFLLGKEPEPSIASELFEKGRLYLKNLRAAGVAMSIEAPIATEIAGVPFDGFCDLSLSTPILGQIIDWKTTSSIKKYGKTPTELAKDAQMLIYARALHPTAEHVDLIHGQYQTKGAPTFGVSTACVAKKEIDTQINSVIIPLVERIKGVVGEKDVTKLTRNPKACFNCPHRAYCPSDEAIQFMSIFSRYHAAPTQALPNAPSALPEYPTTPAAPENPRMHPQMTKDPGHVPTPDVTAPTPVEVESAPAPQPTPPPADPDRGTAQSSGPLIAANPLKRGRGRPPGSSKKVEFSAPAPPVESKENPLPISPGIQFESVTFSYGATVNMGSFNSVRIDVSMTAKHTGDPDAAFQAVMDKVKEKVEIEMAKLAAAPKVGETK